MYMVLTTQSLNYTATQEVATLVPGKLCIVKSFSSENFLMYNNYNIYTHNFNVMHLTQGSPQSFTVSNCNMDLMQDV